jgi:hypothetical protein
MDAQMRQQEETKNINVSLHTFGKVGRGREGGRGGIEGGLGGEGGKEGRKEEGGREKGVGSNDQRKRRRL